MLKHTNATASPSKSRPATHKTPQCLIIRGWQRTVSVLVRINVSLQRVHKRLAVIRIARSGCANDPTPSELPLCPHLSSLRVTCHREGACALRKNLSARTGSSKLHRAVGKSSVHGGGQLVNMGRPNSCSSPLRDDEQIGSPSIAAHGVATINLSILEG